MTVAPGAGAGPGPGSASPASSVPLWAVVAALVLVAVNLRTLMASLPPLAETIRADLGLSSAWMGVLTTVPVLCMGLLAPLANQVARHLGAARAVGLGAALLVAGLSLRGAGSVAPWALYAGTLTAGTGIAVAGTLLPGIVKALFPPQRAGLGTGLTMASLMGGAAVASAMAVPLAAALGGWSRSLLAWAPVALLGLVVWVPVMRAVRHHTLPEEAPEDVSHALPWASATAWLLAAYLACQSWQFYSSLAWLAPTYESHGWSARDAGVLMALFTGSQLVSGLVAPTLLDRVPDARVLLVGAVLVGGAGLLGVWLAPDAAPWAWAALLGAGQGAAFALGLVLLVRYAVTPRDSARLTAMAFLVSYTVAAFGPAAMGAVEDATGGFRWVWALLALVTVPQLALSSRLRPGLRRVGDDRGIPA